VKKFVVLLMAFAIFGTATVVSAQVTQFPISSMGDIVRYLHMVKTNQDSLSNQYDRQDSSIVAAIDSINVWAERVDAELAAIDAYSDSLASALTLLDSIAVSFNRHVQAAGLHFAGNADSIAAGLGVGVGSGDAKTTAEADSVAASLRARATVTALTAPTAIDSTVVEDGVSQGSVTLDDLPAVK